MMRLLGVAAAFLLTTALLVRTEDLECNTADGWFRLGCSKCYKVFKGNDDRSWVRAREICQRYGSQLVTVQDQIENDALGEEVEKQAGKDTHYWIGLSRYDDSQCAVCKNLKWSTGITASDPDGFWSNGQPDESVGECVYSRRMQERRYTYDRPFVWSYGQCNRVMAFVCQREAHPAGHFPCLGGGYVRSEVPNSLICDGVQDCPDGSDELNCQSRCSHYQKGTSGELMTFTYENAKTCTWAIETPLGTNAKIVLNNFETEQQADFVTVFVGNVIEKKATRVARLSGNHGTKEYRSYNNMIFIKFTSDARVTARGFTGSYSSENTGLSSYKKDFIAKDASQTYIQPSFNVAGVQSFVGMTDYIYLIKTEQPLHQIITVDIVTMDIHDSDKIIFYDGDKPSDAVLATMCNKGCSNYPVVFSTGTAMSIFFKTEMEISKSVRFEFRYKQGCSFESNAKWGTLFTPGYIGKINYPNKVKCTWTLNPAEPVTFYFDQDLGLIDNGHGRQNNDDYLEIFDDGTLVSVGGNTQLRSIDLRGQIIKTTTGKLRLTFTTSSTRSARGFMAKWSKACPDPNYDEFTRLSTATLNNFYRGKTTLTCVTGYGFHQGQVSTPQQAVELECGFKGIWEDYRQFPRCTPVYCGDAPQINNGFIIYSSGSVYNSVTQYQCFQGSTLNPPNGENITCGSNGQWGTPPTCQAASCSFGQLSLTFARGNGTLVYNDGTKIASIVKYMCEDGFEINGEPYSFCKADGLWTTGNPSCTAKTCLLPEIKNGAYTAGNSAGGFINYESSASVSCSSGYELKTSAISSVRCNVDRSLTELPQCVDIDECKVGTNPCSHGCVNTVSSYYCTCPDGYNIVTGNRNLCIDIKECDVANPCDKRGRCTNDVPGYTCFCDQPYVLFTADGTSGYKIPQNEDGLRSTDTYHINHTCVLIECKAPATVVNGQVLTKRENHRFGDVIDIQCSLGFVPRRSVHTCGSDGNWSPAIPTTVCAAAQCPNDPIPAFPNNAKYATGPYDYKQQLSLECSTPAKNFTWYRHCTFDTANDVYVMQGSIYDCGEIDCGLPVKYSGTTYTPSAVNTKYGSSFPFACSSGNVATGTSANGDKTVRCQADGLWDFGNLQCQTLACLDPGYPAGGAMTPTTGTLEDGSKVQYSCTRTGYTISGNQERTCNTNTWTGTVPTCIDTQKPTFTASSNCGGSKKAIKYDLVKNNLPSVLPLDNTKVEKFTISPLNANTTLYVTAQSTPVTYRATDYAKNEQICTFTVNLKDETPPSITCPNRRDIELASANSVVPHSFVQADYTISDISNYKFEFVNDLPTSYSFADLYKTFTREAKATDDEGNVATCKVQVFVQPKVPCSEVSFPTMANSDLACGSGSTPTCTVTCHDQYTFRGPGSPSKVKTFTCSTGTGAWTPTPESGCIKDVTDPYAKCPDSTTITLTGADAFQYEDFTTLASQVVTQDLNTISTTTFSPENFNFTGANMYQNREITATVTDLAGRSTTCKFNYVAKPEPCSPLALAQPQNAEPNNCRPIGSGWSCDIKCNEAYVLFGSGRTKTVTCSGPGMAWKEEDMYPACVQDKIRPTITCPLSAVITLNDPNEFRDLDFTQMGNAGYAVTRNDNGEVKAVQYFPSFYNFTKVDLDTTPTAITVKVTDTAINEASCVFFLTVAAAPCSPLSLEDPLNGNKVCTRSANGWSCDYSCNTGYMFGTTTNTKITTTCTDGSPFSTRVSGCIRDNLKKSKEFKGTIRIKYIPTDDTIKTVPTSCLSYYENKQKPSVIPQMATKLRSVCDVQTNILSKFSNFDVSFLLAELSSTVDRALTGDNNIVTIDYVYTMQFADAEHYRICSDNYESFLKNAGNIYTLRNNIAGDGASCPEVHVSQTVSEPTTQPLTGFYCIKPYFPSPTDADSCIPCPAGTQSDTQTCALCPVGKYRSDGVDGDCSSCSNNQITKFTGSIGVGKCIDQCSAGSYSTTGYAPCTRCPIGTYADGSGKTQCTSCMPPETTSNTGMVSKTQCFNQSATTVSAADCPLGTEKSGDTCKLCTEGSYRSQSSQPACLSCLSGFTTFIKGAVSAASCKAGCAAGQTSDNGQAPCKQCLKGSYAVNSTACLQCATGSTTKDDGAISISQCLPTSSFEVNCPPGSVKKSSNCELCAIGTYHGGESTSTNDVCTPCGAGLSTYVTGATSSSQCKVKCQIGFFSANGLSPCQPCGFGKYWVNSTDCLPCPNGGTTATTTSSQCIPKCPKGQFSYSGYNHLGTACRPCPRNYYQDVEGQTDCKPCGSNQYSPTTGLTASSDCQDANDQCTTNYCTNGGICTIASRSPVCNCVKGYYGDRCQTAVNWCLSNPCYNGAQCSSNTTGWYCTCRNQFTTGKDCSTIVSSCVTDLANPTCKQGGNCLNTPDGKKCLCTGGFSGDTCSVKSDICSTKPCAAGKFSSCTDTSKGENLRRKCECFAGYTGKDCEIDIDECASNPCVNNGKCTSGINTFSCACPLGYFGTYCEQRVSRCGSGTCGSTAMCVDDHKDNTYRCICNPGYAYGTYSKFKFYSDKAASNIANLPSKDTTVDQCRKDCVGDPRCYGFSYDTVNSKCYIWTSTVLEPPDNVGYNTYVIDRKEQPDDDFWTDFYDLSKPSNAQLESLTKVQQAGLDICYNTDILASECCKVGDESSCIPTNAHECGGGTTNYAIRFKCSVAKVFEKNSCVRKDYCDGNPCAPRGTCSLSGSSYTCNCVQNGYSGRNCHVDTNDCIGHQCKNMGACIDKVGFYECNCTEGWEGSRCERQKNYCSAGSSTCSSRGQCESQATYFLCKCNTGYEGKTCADEVDYCKSNPCLQGGVCTKKFGGYTCKCKDGWEGTNCDKPVDNCLVPTTGRNCQGTCHNIFNDYFCQCSANKYDKNCASGTDPCVQYNKCLNSGQCSMVNTAMTCSCPTKYKGDGCQTLIDHCGKTNNCKNGATCEVTAAGYKCNCQPGYEGTNCENEVDECKTVTCAGTGSQCFDGINKYYCRCPLKFTGTNCARAYDTYYDLYFNHPYAYAWIPYFIRAENMNALSFSMWVRFALANGEGIYFTQFTGNKLPEAKKWLEFTEKGVNIYPAGSTPVNLEYIRSAAINDGNWNLMNFNYDLEKGEATLSLNTVKQKTVTDNALKMSMSTMDMWTVLGCQFDPAKESCTGTKSFHGYLSQLNAYTRLLTFDSTSSGQGNVPFIYENPQHVFDDGNLLVWNEYLLETGVSRIIPTEAFGTFCRTPGRNPSCSFYSALTRPSVSECPKSFTIYSPTRITTVNWKEPKFHNLGTTGIINPPNALPGGALNWGDFCITYVAKDSNGNKAYCSFKVYVRASQCDRNADFPITLNQQCIPSNILGRQGCSVSCTNPSQFTIDRVQPKLYTCGPSGNFNAKKPFQNWRYPSCGEIQPQPKMKVEIRLEYKISSTACPHVITNVLKRILEEFVKMRAFFNGALCTQADCTDVKIDANCGKSRRRRATSAITVVDITLFGTDASTSFDSETLTIKEFLTYFALGADVFDFSDTIPDGNLEKDRFYIKVTPVCPDKEVLVGSNCVKCGPGNYFRYTDATNTTAICDDCPIGQYQTLADQEKCVGCGAQLTTEMTGTFKSEGCKKSCPIGHFFNDTANDCSKCDIGYYQDEVGQFYCKFCGAGFTTDDYGATSASKCSETCKSGFQLDSSGDCQACAIGQYRNVTESRTCLPCQAGFITKNTASVSKSDCKVRACNTGTKLVEASNTCVPCEVGTYQPAQWKTTCIPCGDGNMSRYMTDQPGSDSPDQCFFYCPSGFQITDPTKTDCTICEVGFYKDNNDDLRSSCRACEGNKRTENQGAKSKAECTIYKCLKGHKANAANTDCEKCPLGTYQDVLHSTFCKNCTGTKTSTRQVASESPSDCEEYCDPGYQITSSGCMQCMMGYYKDNNLGLFTNCTKCPQYFTTVGNGTALKSECNIPTCDPGNKRNAADNGCEECPLGTYQSLPYQRTCDSCTTGTSTRQVNSTQASQCEAYCESGLEKNGTQCDACERGYYKDNSDGLFGSCVMCPVAFITAGPQTKTKAECDTGNCTAGQKLNGKVCENCPKGTYQSQKWQTTCLPCGKDKTTENDKADDVKLCILVCQPGFEDINGECKPCSVGYYKVEEAAAKCKLCPGDTITEGTGSTSTANCTLPACKPGNYLDRSVQPTPACKQCPYDQFQTEQWKESCESCGGGTVTLAMGADKPELCVENCTSGSQFISGTGCSDCPIGYYRNQFDRSQATCQMCDAKFITLTEGGKSVSDCNIVNCTTPGLYRHANNTCQKCPYGTYASDKWLTQCKSCQTGYTTLNEGSTLPSDCRPSCPAGQYVGTGNQCKFCTKGTYKSTTQDVPCTNCSGGFTTVGEGAKAATECNLSPCVAGEKYITASLQCMKCEVGSYQDLGGQTDCKQCPHTVKYTPRQGAVAVTECDSPCTIGNFLNVTSGSCQPCPMATYQDETKSFACKSCPTERKFTSSTGKTSMNDCVSYCSTSGANSCSANATCLEDNANANGYTCACNQHHEDFGAPVGRYCMHKCDRGYCKNNAQCVADPGPVCKCTEWYEGSTCDSRKKAEELADTTLDIIIPVAISAGALLLFLIILAVCCVFYMHRKKADKPPTRFSEYPQERVDKASLQSYDYGQRPFNGAGPQRLMLAPYSEMVYDNQAFTRPDFDKHSTIDSAVYEA